MARLARERVQRRDSALQALMVGYGAVTALDVITFLLYAQKHGLESVQRYEVNTLGSMLLDRFGAAGPVGLKIVSFLAVLTIVQLLVRRFNFNTGAKIGLGIALILTTVGALTNIIELL